MSAPKHTPGPWTNSPPRVSLDGDCFVYGPEGLAIARVYGVCPRDTDAREANARLIAAAPELYEALKYTHEFMRGAFVGPFPGIEAALAKAEGRE